MKFSTVSFLPSLARTAFLVFLLSLSSAAQAHIFVISYCGGPKPPQFPDRICNELRARIEVGQRVKQTFDRDCLRCGFEIPDITDIAPIQAWQELVEAPGADWAVSLQPVMESRVPGVADDPAKQNLLVSYVGSREIAGPAPLVTLQLRGSFNWPEGVPYVGRALDAKTGEVVVNTGVIRLTEDPAPNPDPTACRGLWAAVIVLLILLLLAVAAWLRARRR
jgi:hypothetical protein